MGIKQLIEQISLQWFYKTTGIDEPELDLIEKQIAFDLPTDYRHFMEWSDGGTGVFPNAKFRRIEVVLWPAEKIDSLNKGYKIQHYLGPEILAIGDNGGGHHFIMDFRYSKSPSIAVIPSGDLSEESIKSLAGSFTEFMDLASKGYIDEDSF